MNFASVIGLVLSVGLLVIEFIDEQGGESEKEYKYISLITTGIYILYMIGDSLFAEGIIASVLPWIEKYFYLTLPYILVAAVAPNIAARRECKKGTFYAEKNYLSGNLKFNLLGAFAVEGLLLLMRIVIGDLNSLRWFYINDVVPLVAPICVHMTFLYQKREQRKGQEKKLDYDASLKHISQRLNLFYLFNTYFLGLISAAYIVIYTIYSQMYHMTLPLNIACLFLLSFVLIFFYALTQHPHYDLYLTAYIAIPIILIGCAYWMSWLAQSREIRSWQWFFITFHSVIYILLIFKKEGVITVEKCSETGKRKLASKHSNLLFLPCVVLTIYGLIWILPHSTDRISINEAYNYIDMLCLDADMDVDSVIEQASGQAMYDEANQSFDVEKFMKYLSEVFSAQLVDKGIIKKEGDVPIRRDMENWYLNVPRYPSIY